MAAGELPEVACLPTSSTEVTVLWRCTQLEIQTLVLTVANTSSPAVLPDPLRGHLHRHLHYLRVLIFLR